MVMTRRGLYD
jgi:hypothetical protein